MNTPPQNPPAPAPPDTAMEPAGAPQSLPLGTLLKQAGLIKEPMIEYALKIQKATNERLGAVLLRLRMVTDDEIARVLARQTGLAYDDLDGATSDPTILKQIPYVFAKKTDMLPVAVENERLIIAVGDPFSERAMAQIGRFTHYPVTVHVAPQAKLRRLIDRFYYRLEHPLTAEVEQITLAAREGRNYSTERLVDLVLNTALDLRASDIHISPTETATLVSYRTDGVLHPQYAFHASTHSRIVSTIKVTAGMNIAEQNRPQDGRMTLKFLGDEFDLRISTIPTAHGENMVIRLLATGVGLMSVVGLGFDERQVEAIVRLVEQPYGMILATGPTGSGKSTTLYALLRYIDCIENNVLTVEDPIEFDMPLVHQVAVNEKAGVTFASAIRTFFRQDPDIILVGEIRDEETATLGIRAALTGHLVLSTLHTNDAAGRHRPPRDLGVGMFLLSNSLSGVVAQRLLRRLCSYCKRPVTLTDAERQRFGIKASQAFRAVGCDRCLRTGYLGRVAAGEVLEIDGEIQGLVANGRPAHEIQQAAQRKGMHTIKDSALRLVAAGLTDLAEVGRVVK